MKDLIIIGVGGVGREAALIAEEINEQSQEWNILGFVDDNEDVQNTYINGYPVLGKSQYLQNYKDEVYVFCGISNYKVKKKIISKLKENQNIKFATLIHPSVKLNKHIKIGEGCIIYQNVIMTVNIEIGDHVIISPKCGIGHDSKIHDYVTLLWNVNVSGNVDIKEGATMGSGSTVIQGLTIGEGSFVGAGATVIRDIDKYKTAVGVPTRYV